MYYKVKEEGRVINRWLGVLANLQQRGIADILIACIDNLKGFAEAIARSAKWLRPRGLSRRTWPC
jgi:transposase-like protein